MRFQFFAKTIGFPVGTAIGRKTCGITNLVFSTTFDMINARPLQLASI
jgi:hypothetical protein